MSIIYDSLKKIEKGKIPASTKPKDEVLKNLKLIAFYGIFSLMGALLSIFAFKHFFGNPSGPKKTRYASKAKAAVPAPLKDVHRATPALKMAAPLALNGIFFSENEGYALINNQIVQEGDEVEGAYVQKISEDEVELKNNAGLVKLTTSAR